MASKILPQKWMDDANSVAVMLALTKKGAKARFVGGCVRDAVLNRPINDIDIATDALPETVIKLLKESDIKAIPTGLKHGTITAVVNHQPFEITTLRHDIENFGRHANVAFSASWMEDAARRDFTMNAMSLDIDGTLHDYFGGYSDATKGLVRFVGNPIKRIEEDYLRLLRYFRFHAFYGTGVPDPQSLSACNDLACHLKSLSGERIRQEILKLFKAPNPMPVLAIMDNEGIFEHLFTKPVIKLCTADFDALKRYIDMETKHKLDIDSLCRMAVFLKRNLDNTKARKLANRIILSNQEKVDWLCYILQDIDVISPMESSANYQKLDQLGSRNFKKLLAISAAYKGCDISHDWWEFINQKADLVFPLHGRDILSLGIPAGPTVGRLLTQTRQWWLTNGMVAPKEECLAFLQDLAKKIE